MHKYPIPSTILLVTWPLAIMIAVVSSIGLLTNDFYSAETVNWQAQSIGQDMIDLFLVVPILITSVFYARKGSIAGMIIWGGTLLYIIYSFCIYCFSVHFNSLFILYCLILGLSFYSLIYFIYLQNRNQIVLIIENKSLRKIAGWYLVLIAITFYFLWLSEILPAIIGNSIPLSLSEAGLPTNPVHVLDLSVILPGIFITGFLFLKGKSIAFFLTPVFLVFFIIMDITIGFLIAYLYHKGLAETLIISYMMGILALASLILLAWFFHELKAIEK